MTPGINQLKQNKIAHTVHEYSHQPGAESYGNEAVAKLGVAEALVFKTLLVSLDGKELAVAIIPVASKLSMKLIAKALGAKKAAMAAKTDVERSTGYVLGGVSPLGQKRSLRTVIHSSATALTTMYVSAGRRGLEIELKPEDLKAQLKSEFVEICQ